MRKCPERTDTGRSVGDGLAWGITYVYGQRVYLRGDFRDRRQGNGEEQKRHKPAVGHDHPDGIARETLYGEDVPDLQHGQYGGTTRSRVERTAKYAAQL